MVINNHEINVSLVAYDGCHKIYLPCEGQEKLFIESMIDKGWVLDEDFHTINNASELLDIYLCSCPLRFIEQIYCAGSAETLISIIPQGAFTDDEGVFNEDSAREAFMD